VQTHLFAASAFFQNLPKRGAYNTLFVFAVNVFLKLFFSNRLSKSLHVLSLDSLEVRRAFYASESQCQCFSETFCCFTKLWNPLPI